jgi:hypothetical protein
VEEFCHRWYDNRSGRYTQADPIGLAGGANLYGYAGANPTRRVDPNGLYNEQVHYFRTKLWSEEAGLSPSQAEMIASADQGLDDDFWTTSPWWPWSGWRHFREREDVLSDIFEAIEALDLADFGRHLHELQDTFSHAGYNYCSGGHAVKLRYLEHWGADWVAQGEWPDNYNPMDERDQRMERHTRMVLRKLVERLRRDLPEHLK